MHGVSIWLQEGRMVNHGRQISLEELSRLKNKRIRQLERLIVKAPTAKIKARLEARLMYLL